MKDVTSWRSVDYRLGWVGHHRLISTKSNGANGLSILASELSFLINPHGSPFNPSDIAFHVLSRWFHFWLSAIDGHELLKKANVLLQFWVSFYLRAWLIYERV